MDTWEVRWRAPAEPCVALDDILRLPLTQRPFAVLPIRDQAPAACDELRSLATVFPGIVLTIDASAMSAPYTSVLLQYARRGFAILEGERYERVSFSIDARGTWTPEQAYQILTRVSSTIGRDGIVERFFPDDLPARMAAERAPDAQAWERVASAYRLNNGLRLYAEVGPSTRAIHATLKLADGVVLEPGTVPPDGTSALWRGTVEDHQRRIRRSQARR